MKSHQSRNLRWMLSALALSAITLIGWRMGRNAVAPSPEEKLTSAKAPATKNAGVQSGATINSEWSQQLASFSSDSSDSSTAIEWMGEVVADLNEDELVRFLMTALTSPSMDVRLEALRHSSLLELAKLKPLLIQALSDSNPRIRERAFGKIHEKPDAFRIEIFQLAASMPKEEVVRYASEWLAVTPSEEGTSALIEAYQEQKNPKLAAIVRDSLQRLTGENFTNATEAKVWWQKNQM